MSRAAAVGVVEYIAAHPELSHVQARALVLLAEYHNAATGQCNPGYATLAGRMGLGANKGYGRRILEGLDAAGHVHLDPPSKGGRGHGRQVGLPFVKVAAAATFPPRKVAVGDRKGSRGAPAEQGERDATMFEPSPHLVGGKVQGESSDAAARPETGAAAQQQPANTVPEPARDAAAAAARAATMAAWREAEAAARQREADARQRAAAEREQEQAAKHAAAASLAAAAPEPERATTPPPAPTEPAAAPPDGGRQLPTVNPVDGGRAPGQEPAAVAQADVDLPARLDQAEVLAAAAGAG